MGLLDQIHGTKKAKKRGALISLDIKKAFDSISHSYMNEALKFFNFGENFIKWINVLCTNREACVILLDNKVGPNFKLKRGNAQGDTISPFLFNICYQLLLFKLECDLQIKDLGVTLPVPSSPLYSTEPPVSNFAKKVFTFADDCNVLCKYDDDSFARIKNVLEDFATISGLECNLEKTNVLVIGEQINDFSAITNHGFVQKNSLKILGMSISNNLEDNITEGAGHIRRKLVEKITTWGRFNLSLPGRIQIAKTMLYSQVNYLGCFLPFPMETLADWELLISQFVAGNLRIGIQRIFSPVEIGGLGLFRLEKFLDAQKIRWIVYSMTNINADWKLSLHKSSIQDVFRTDLAYLDNLSPVLITIIQALVNLKKNTVKQVTTIKK
jgi:hypothetical protein